MSDTPKKSKKKSQKKKADGSKKKAIGRKKKADGSKKKASAEVESAEVESAEVESESLGKRKYTPQKTENTAKKMRFKNDVTIFSSKTVEPWEFAKTIKRKLLEGMHTQNWPKIHMAGNESTNRAIKAFVKLRKLCLESTNQDIIVKPDYQSPNQRNKHGGRDTLDFYTCIVRTCDEYPEPAEESKEIFKVSSGSDPTKMAYAMRSKFIEGQHVVVRAIGKNAVNLAVKSIVLMRIFLKKDDDNEKDVGFCPSFFKIPAESDGKKATDGMQFDIYECPKDN